MALSQSKPVLACIDGSTYLESVCQHAHWAAQQCDTSLTLLHVQASEYAPDIDLSGTLELDASATLLAQLSQIDEARSKVDRTKGQLIIAHATRILADATLPMTALHRSGALVDTLTEQEATTQMIVIGKRGEQAQHAVTHLGSNLERVVRAVTIPVLATTPVFRDVRRIAIAYDGELSAHKALDFVINHPRLHTCDIHLVMVDADARQRQAGATALARLTDRQIIAQLHHVSGRPAESITSFVDNHDVQLVLMGAYSHSPLRTLFIGSTTTAILTNCSASVLLFH